MGDSNTPARALRDQIVAAYLEGGTAVLVSHLDALCTLRTPDGEYIALLAYEDLPVQVGALVANHVSGTLHVVVVGDDGTVAAQLKKAAPFWQMSRRYGFDMVSLDGNVTHVTGQRLWSLTKAVAAAPGTAPLDAERLAALGTQGAQQQAQENALVQGLRARFPWVTVAIGALCVALFALGKLWESGNFQVVLYRMGADFGPAVKQGEVWRLLSAAFLHLNIEHIVVNMIALAGFGPVLEQILGPRRYLLLYGLSALGGGVASAFVRTTAITSVGASGAIWGLMTGAIGLALRPRGLLPPVALQRLRARAGVPLAINVIYSFTPGVDLYAHFGGGLVGFALLASGLLTIGVQPIWTAPAAPAPAKRSPALAVAAAVMALAMLGSVGAALAVGQPWRIGARPVLATIPLGDSGLVVDVPARLGKPTVTHHTGYDAYEIYDWQVEPVGVEAYVGNAMPAPDQLAQALEEVRTTMPQHLPKGATATSQPSIVSLGDHRAVTMSLTIDKLEARQWVTYLGGHDVFLRVVSLPNPAPAWAPVPEQIARSLRPK